MRQRYNHAIRHPLHTVVKAVALVVGLWFFAQAAYAHGVQHAITTAVPYVDGASILIDFDGQVHEYR